MLAGMPVDYLQAAHVLLKSSSSLLLLKQNEAMLKPGTVMTASFIKRPGNSKMEIKELFFNKLATQLTIKTITKGKRHYCLMQLHLARSESEWVVFLDCALATKYGFGMAI